MHAVAAPPSPSPGLAIRDDGIARVVFDDPDRSANVLTEGVMRRFSEVIERLEQEAGAGRVRGVLIESGKPASFIVGADIDAIAGIESPALGAEAARTGQRILGALERLPVPTVAAIHGTCMGGGTEIALACTYRLASDDPKTKLALPEVQLGILPAWGGTTRLPRLIGLQSALDLILTGRSVDAQRARRVGLVDDVVPPELLQRHALAFLEARLATGPVPSGARRGLGTRLLEDTAPGRRAVLRAARRKVESRVGRHYPAPFRILEVVRGSLGRPVEHGMELEAEAAGELLPSGVSKNLVHVFRLREAARKGRGLGLDAEPVDVRAIGVVGAGVMGGGIAQLAARHEIRARLKDLAHAPVGDALRHARGLFERDRSRGRLTRREMGEAMERISGGVTYAGFARVDLVVEAVVERLDVKRTVLREVEQRVAERCVLATNTSTLSVDAMAEALERPERFCGMHFFNPVHRMPLVEVVRGGRTSDATVATVHALARRMGKVPVVVADGPGFLVNRILGPYLNEAGHLLAEGASVDAVDAAARAFGLPMGPLRLVDEVGLDIARHAGEVLHEAFGDRMAPSDPLVRMGESGRTGRKGGLGFYRYDDGEADDPSVDPDLDEIFERGTRRPDESEIRARLLLAMINEAARALEDGIVPSAADVDLAMIMGTGFPPFRGGLLRFADRIHARALVERLDRYEDEIGPRFESAAILRELARTDRGFYEAFPARGGDG